MVERQAREKGLGLRGPDPAQEKPSAETLVYITKTGTNHHRAGCRSLAKSSTAIPLGQVGGRYEACAVCDPPRLVSDDAEGAPKTQPGGPGQSAGAVCG